MIELHDFVKVLTEKKVNFFTGVPDSLLKDFCAYITDNLNDESHVISSNEGSAVALAIGHYLATESIPLIYMQNSGIGNAINPLLSLASREVYGIPMVLFIGWRGEPGVKDEPQHVHQGRITEQLLEVMDIPYVVLNSDTQLAVRQTAEYIDLAAETHGPVAILIRKGTFQEYKLPISKDLQYELTREKAIKTLAEQIDESTVIVATTGMASRELFDHRVLSGQGHDQDFLTVGGMGHANQIALGIAKANKKVCCFDGDGAILMHMGSMAIIGQSNLKNMTHIVLNNGTHDSVGGQPTIARSIKLTDIALSCGYDKAVSVASESELIRIIREHNNSESIFVEINVKPGNRPDIGRPTTSPQENKKLLMRRLK
jgi:phosphonopyruvate decarboxylase